jgi:hypothetical protein
VVKRGGHEKPVHFAKITARIMKMVTLDPPLNEEYVDPIAVAQKVVLGVFPGVKTTDLDTLAAETTAHMSTIHADYGALPAPGCFQPTQTNLDQLLGGDQHHARIRQPQDGRALPPGVA